MAACGQTMTHLAHWMQIDESQTGISCAKPRFSQRAVAVGKVPSTGIALTGRPSPSPAKIGPRTSRTKSGASVEMAGAVGSERAAAAGLFTSWRCLRLSSTARRFFWTSSSLLWP